MVCVLLVTNLLVGCAKDEPVVKEKTTKAVVNEAATEAEVEEEAAVETSKDKIDVKFYGKVVEYTSGPLMTDAMEELLKNDYNIDSIQVDWGNQDQVIRTGIASGDPCDVYNYTPSAMVNFLDMALDLKPFLDADPEWAAQFNQGALDAATYDGKILNLPWEQNFPVVLANKTALDALGIVVPEAWTIEEFGVFADQIRAAGVYPFTNATDLGRSSWMYRNAMLSIVATEGLTAEYAAGTLDLTGPESVAALEAVKSLYDNDYMYPGVGAVTVKNDEIKAGFYSGQVLMMPEIAAGAKQTSLAADFEVMIVPWPSAGEVGAINGVYNGLFVPQNVKDPAVSVALIKAFTSEDIQAIHGAEGYIPANNKVAITDPFVNAVLQDAGNIGTEYPFSTEMMDYFRIGIIPDLVLNGGVDTAIEAMGALN